MSGDVSDGDADTVQVESTFSGTLLIKNMGAGDRSYGWKSCACRQWVIAMFELA